MGKDLPKTVFLSLTPFLLLHLLISSSSGAQVKTNDKGVCISEGRQYEPEGTLANLELKDLKTCCSDSHMQTASLAVENLATKEVIDIKASKWDSNGTALCDAVGFANDSEEEEPCYVSKASLEAEMESEPSEVKKTEKVERFRDRLPQILYEAELFEIEFWIHLYVQQGIFRFFRLDEMIARLEREARRD